MPMMEPVEMVAGSLRLTHRLRLPSLGQGMQFSCALPKVSTRNIQALCADVAWFSHSRRKRVGHLESCLATSRIWFMLYLRGLASSPYCLLTGYN